MRDDRVLVGGCGVGVYVRCYIVYSCGEDGDERRFKEKCYER